MQVSRNPQPAPEPTRENRQPPRCGALRLLGYGLALAAIVVGMAWLLRTDAWNEVTLWIQATQRELHRHLAAAMRGLAEDGPRTAWALAGMSLLYGVFHAAGPGHGKAVIATYLGSNRVQLRRGVLLSVLSALAQGITAILIVEIAMNLFGLSMRHTQRVGMQLENASFALVALLGAALALRSAITLWKRHRAGAAEEHVPAGLPSQTGSLFSTGGNMRAYCAECGALHGPSRRHIEQPLALRTAGAIILSIGLRPCTGALLVLLVAYSLDMRWAGIASVLAMSAGTAATVSMLAAATVFTRQGAFRLLRTFTRNGRLMQAAFDLLGVLGGLLILAMGSSLLLQEFQTQPHPLFAR